jgi:hypothetical protein
VRGVVAAIALLLGISGPGAAQHVPTPIPGWEQVAAQNPRFVIFGELHGTAESPRLVGQVAAMLAAQGQRVLVAIEHDAQRDAALQTLWAEPHEGFAERLLSATRWAGRQDGVASVAMRDMLQFLHAKRSQGAAISVTAFNGFRDDAQHSRLQTPGSQTGHERAQAENIAAAAERGRYDIVLVLVGSLHARRAMLQLGDFRVLPMAMHLSSRGSIVSLQMISGGGSSWICTDRAGARPIAGETVGPEPLYCGAQVVRDRGLVTGAPMIALGPVPGHRDESPRAFDGYYWVGPVTASPPAVP